MSTIYEDYRRIVDIEAKKIGAAQAVKKAIQDYNPEILQRCLQVGIEKGIKF